MFPDCSQQSHPPNSKRPLFLKPVEFARDSGGGVGGGEGKCFQPILPGESFFFSVSRHEIWLSQPVFFFLLFSVPRGHVRRTGRLDVENYSTGPELQVKGEGVEQGRASFCHGDTGLLSGVSSEYVSHDYCFFGHSTAHLELM